MGIAALAANASSTVPKERWDWRGPIRLALFMASWMAVVLIVSWH